MSLLRALLQPRSIAIAITPGDQGGGQVIVSNLIADGAPGGVFVVARGDHSGPQGNKYTTKDWSELPATPDLAIICTAAGEAAEALDMAGKRGIKTAVVCTDDPDGRSSHTPLKRALLDAARRHGSRFLGPGSAGLNLPAASVNASWISGHPAVGKLALVSQSGTVAASVVGWAKSRGIGMSRVISVGDEADLGVDAMLDTLAADTRTHAILLHLHSLSNGRAFMTSARAAARIKPVLVLRPPHVTSGKMIELDDDREDIFDAAFARAGLLRVHDTEEWFNAAESLLRPVRRRGGKLAIVANGSGSAMLAAATAEGEGLLANLCDTTIAQLCTVSPSSTSVSNPLVLPRQANADSYRKALAILCEDQGVASATVIYSPSSGGADSEGSQEAATIQAIAESAAQSDLQVSVCWFGTSLDNDSRAALHAANVASYDLPEQAVRAFMYRERHRRNQETLRQVPDSLRQQLVLHQKNVQSDGQVHRHALMTTDETESAAFLGAYGMICGAVMSGRYSLGDAEGNEVLRAFGFRVTEGLETSRATIPLSLVIANDPDFGRMILVIAAGVRAVTLPPLNRELTRALAMAARARLRSATGVDIPVDAIQDGVIRVGDMACDLPEIVSLELRCTDFDDGGLVLCASSMHVAEPGRADDHLSLRSYPRDLEEHLHTKDGRDVLVRPIRSEDVRLYREMLDRIPKDDLYLRFCSQYSDITQAIPTDLLANLVHLDYSRDMTFIAIGTDEAGVPVALGVVDAFMSAGGEEAEFSILVRSDLAGSGLGKALMTKIIDYCRAKRVVLLFGLVLRKNARMLGLSKRLGFIRMQDDEADEDMVKVALELR